MLDRLTKSSSTLTSAVAAAASGGNAGGLSALERLCAFVNNHLYCAEFLTEQSDTFTDDLEEVYSQRLVSNAKESAIVFREQANMAIGLCPLKFSNSLNI
jgi:hypothetical protein